MTSTKDIQTRADVEHLIRTFYEKVLVDKTIAFIFIDVAQIDLDKHFPHLFDFWENILLTPNGYKRNVLKVHLDLNQKVPLRQEHFERWLELFTNTVDELFEGTVANNAKNKALSIATVMQTKLHRSKGLL
ncbi:MULTISPECIES: group III truncated hemoglobin [unclassified Aureispira]|uniref:group III truncated hemoglobin n=1 Tax=unclassified Aureispira TaxID=2649989 RepID=UPI0006973779|nr:MULTISPECIES: group III truncated hemoglobin [unclassified Aureispira]WMX12109.1 group III truncated hemoglobin [Aureispira sp. CCB-E]